MDLGLPELQFQTPLQPQKTGLCPEKGPDPSNPHLLLLGGPLFIQNMDSKSNFTPSPDALLSLENNPQPYKLLVC